ncbi:hypothetical protein ElyMa_006891500 [Elysia marginata]|uniref:Galectin n=1 Tax=Elysia marginata TaxID=1093978 RepID=A0AAV4JCR9_9GAST|nr:hypothetical protein ElyMa_006891500 [Elysia marginata]
MASSLRAIQEVGGSNPHYFYLLKFVFPDPGFGRLLQIQRHFRLGYSFLILGNHFRFRLSSHYLQKRGVELQSLDEESVQLLRLWNCSDEQIPGQVLLRVSGANPRSLHPLLDIPPEPLDLRFNLRFARFDEVLLMVDRVVTVNERRGVPPRSVLTV